MGRKPLGSDLKVLVAFLKQNRKQDIVEKRAIESGAGLVKATVNGKKEVISIEINDSIINKKDKKIAQDLIVAAVNKALKDVDFKSKEHIKSKTKDIIPDIPGFDIGNIFK